MRKFLRSPVLYASVAAMCAFLAFAAVAGATVDPTLTTASNQVTTYFTTNLTVAIGAFVTVCGVLWILALIFRSVGIHRRRSVG